jgi:hypothetical protein
VNVLRVGTRDVAHAVIARSARFDELAKTVVRLQAPAPRTESLSPAVSGTHVIGTVHALPIETRVLRGG